MRIILFSFLIFAGCQSGPTAYDPVDWHSTPVPQQQEQKPQEQKEEIPSTTKELLRLHNYQRELKGRSGLQLDPYLCDYAQKHAEWMASKSNLKHSDIGKLMGKYSTAGENIAWNQQDEQEVVTAWMNSSGHRANILNRNFTKVGFGLAYNSKNQPYWCTVFAN